MERLCEIVNGTKATLSHVCQGKVCYQIRTSRHLYQLEIDSMEKDWQATFLLPEFKAVTLLRWIRRGLELNDGSFIILN